MTLIQFDDGSGRRIGSAVRFVEELAGKRKPLLFDRVDTSSPGKLSVATFTGSWETGTWKTVTLVGGTNTASVYNWTTPVLSDSCSRYVVFGKASGTNSLVEVQLQATCSTCTLTLGGVDLTQIAGYSSTEIQLLGHGAADEGSTCASGLQWYSISTCATATSA